MSERAIPYSLWAAWRADYEGKTYNDLVADYVCVSASTAGQTPAQSTYAAPAPTDNFTEIEDDGELPF